MSSLEAKIKALLEGTEDSISEDDIISLEEKETITTKGGTTITDDDDKDSDHDEPDADNKGGPSDNDEDNDNEDEGSDEDTDVSKDTKKDNPKVVEEETKGLKQGADNVSGAADTAKIKAGQSRKDEVKTGKLKQQNEEAELSEHQDGLKGPKSDSETGGEKTSKIVAGKSRKDEVKTGQIPGQKTVNEPNAKNQGNVKIALEEHLAAIFSGEELSEEFMAKTQTIFEAAVEASAQARFEALREEYEAELNEQAENMAKQIDEAVEEVKSELVEDVDGFLNYVVEQWVEDNQVALASGVKVDLVDSFIDGMKNLFKEHYIEVPDEKVDVIEEQAEAIEGLTEQVTSLEEQAEQMFKELVEAKSAIAFNKVSAGMTAVQLSKFKDLAESVEFSDEDDYVNKLKTIRESYFAQKAPELKQDDSTSQDSGNVNAYVSAISKNIKFV